VSELALFDFPAAAADATVHVAVQLILMCFVVSLLPYFYLLVID
jgi:hypothetical protein